MVAMGRDIIKLVGESNGHFLFNIYFHENFLEFVEGDCTVLILVCFHDKMRLLLRVVEDYYVDRLQV